MEAVDKTQLRSILAAAVKDGHMGTTMAKSRGGNKKCWFFQKEKEDEG